jgi:hypothetical protein
MRVPAADLDRLVVNCMAKLLRSPRKVHDVLEPLQPDAVMLQAVANLAALLFQIYKAVIYWPLRRFSENVLGVASWLAGEGQQKEWTVMGRHKLS